MKRFLILLAFLSGSLNLIAQKPDTVKKASSADDLMNSMNVDSTKHQVVDFRSTRLILSQTTETIKKNTFNFLVIHRFGDFAGRDGGGKSDFGLDAIADVYIGFEYGLTDKLNLQFGRSTIPSPGGLVSLGLKYNIIHQTTDNSTPISITLLGETGVRTYNNYPSFGDRVSYFGQAIISHQFSPTFTLQISPGFVQDGSPLPAANGIDDSFFSLSAAARLKVSRHMSLIVDYARPFST